MSLKKHVQEWIRMAENRGWHHAAPWEELFKWYELMVEVEKNLADEALEGAETQPTLPL